MPSVAPSRVKYPMTPQGCKEIRDVMNDVIRAIRNRNGLTA